MIPLMFAAAFAEPWPYTVKPDAGARWVEGPAEEDGITFTRPFGLPPMFEMTNVVTPDVSLQVDSDEPGELEEVRIGDRPAYLWRTNGKLGEDDVVVETFYTAWERRGLNCVYAAQPGSPALDAVADAFRGIRVTDPDAHPMERSLDAAYRDWWPYTHPALQLYWVPPLLVLGSVLGVWRMARK